MPIHPEYLKKSFPKILMILMVFLSFAACKPSKEENEPVPSTIINEEKFIQILTDAYLGEGASGVNVKNVQGEKYDSTYLFNPIADNHITRTQLDSAIVYYTAHPKRLKLIYDKVLEKLSQIQAKGKLETK